MKYPATFALAAWSLSAFAQYPNVINGSQDTDAWNHLIKLSGTWRDDAYGSKPTVVYRLSSKDSVLTETLFPRTPEERITVYYLDFEGLAAQHFDSRYIRPLLQLKMDYPYDMKTFVFAPDRYTPHGTYTHDVTIKMLSKDHIREDWHIWSFDKPTSTVKLDLHRVS